jgi:hypothetical protein
VTHPPPYTPTCARYAAADADYLLLGSSTTAALITSLPPWQLTSHAPNSCVTGYHDIMICAIMAAHYTATVFCFTLQHANLACSTAAISYVAWHASLIMVMRSCSRLGGTHSTLRMTMAVDQSTKPVPAFLSPQVLEHQVNLHQRLQDNMRPTSMLSAPIPPASAQSTPHPASTAVQVSLLRAALAEANYRLAAAGLPPVAATDLQESTKLVCTLSRWACVQASIAYADRLSAGHLAAILKMLNNKHSVPRPPEADLLPMASCCPSTNNTADLPDEITRQCAPAAVGLPLGPV